MKHLKLFEQYTKKNEYIVYHGSDKDFESFDKSKIGSGKGNWHGQGFYFSDSKAEASLYGDNLYKVKITLNKPIDLTKIKDTSVQGSGLVHFFATSIDELGKLDYNDYTFNKLSALIKNLERKFNYDNIFFAEGRKGFKEVIYETDEKDYIIHNRTEDEIKSKEYLKSIIISKILEEKYNINRLPISIDEATSPAIFTDIVEEKDYDGVITYNSTVIYGKEYIVFDASNIEMIEKIK